MTESPVITRGLFKISANPVVANQSLFTCGVLGAKVATLVNDAQVAGAHTIAWNTSNVEAGIYTVIAKTSTGSKSVRVAVQ